MTIQDGVTSWRQLSRANCLMMIMMMMMMMMIVNHTFCRVLSVTVWWTNRLKHTHMHTQENKLTQLNECIACNRKWSVILHVILDTLRYPSEHNCNVRFLIKLFKTNIINDCCSFFSFKLPSERIQNRKTSFDLKYCNQFFWLGDWALQMSCTLSQKW